ncbi:RagB/SusD family nutrient uptake outer membrane protein [Aestuariibaculum marinum]|uniref:RagB/SusD family nutrient uptake outer membrane protein n=1 Tax=Aestuariibaculum marinum TaxID=2683592 RepID=A0A8J6Q2S9_9FLAO|nr:RagB/SusD family nutrient uptake outer membrane protein [Aestuariibaculum marinum]MBD0824237.1 RagB/SusD family nutrient uptake outer membrane protein [Aestuariibaculum marinum]
MKKIIYTLLLIPVFGCSDFLDEVDQDKLIPETTDHYAALLLNEFSFDYPVFSSIDHMTDNMVEDPKGLSSEKWGRKTTFTWQREIEIDENGNELGSINNAWEQTYEDIAITNYVIELIDEASGEQSEIDNIKGEAYFVRALSYFNLLNLYGKPYNPESADVDLGVPLRDDIGVESTYTRNSVAEGYDLVESDLLKAIEFISASGITKSAWHPNLATCNLLMSRVKLYQEKWDEVISYSDKVIQAGTLTKMSSTVPFVRDNNAEILYSYYTTRPIHNLYNFNSIIYSPYRVNNELINLYDANDLRKDVFFLGVDDGTGKLFYRTKKYETGRYTDLGFANFRVAEAYLNRAEAYAQKQEYANALNDIETLHASRYSNVSGIVYPTDDSEVLTYVLNERRKELCFEDHHRWFDLRRMDNRPEIKHVYTIVEDDNTVTGTETYTLLPDDLNYTLPIPLKERENNPLIYNNERYEKIPTIED